MDSGSLTYIFLSAALINNFVLSAFLGICPFIGVSKKIDTAARMGAAVTFVMFVSSMCAYGLNILLGYEGEALQFHRERPCRFPLSPTVLAFPSQLQYKLLSHTHIALLQTSHQGYWHS